MAHLRPRVNTGTSPGPGNLGRPRPPAPEDSYLAKVVKYIPAESVAGYQAALGFVPTADQPAAMPYFAIFLILFTPCWILFATKDRGERWAWYQSTAGFFAFLVWLFAVDSGTAAPTAGASARSVSCRSITPTGRPKGVPRRQRAERAAALAHVAQNHRA
jgi:hypothetical protein